jgi:hypothetical protein
MIDEGFASSAGWFFASYPHPWRLWGKENLNADYQKIRVFQFMKNKKENLAL